MTSINLLFAIDDGYVEQFKVTLFSIVHNSNASEYNVYILQKEKLKKHAELTQFCNELKCVNYFPIIIGEKAFEKAPTTNRYPETIYYRLLAHEYLPNDIDRILYLDADILCINDISKCYQMELLDNLYAAASHTKEKNVTEFVNKIRLGNYEAGNYVNSGVVLMNLPLIRQTVKREIIMDFIETKGPLLFLPDQDILNALYGHQIRLLADELYNYDTRMYRPYKLKSSGYWNDDWIATNTVFLHYCGRDKPWHKSHHGHFGLLYKHYMKLVSKMNFSLSDIEKG